MHLSPRGRLGVGVLVSCSGDDGQTEKYGGIKRDALVPYVDALDCKLPCSGKIVSSSYLLVACFVRPRAHLVVALFAHH